MDAHKFPAFATPEEGEVQTEVVYNAYVQRICGTAVNGDPVPFWKNNPLEDRKQAWREAVNAGEQWRKDHESNKTPDDRRELAALLTDTYQRMLSAETDTDWEHVLALLADAAESIKGRFPG